MRFEHSMRGQTVTINYGTTPQGPFIWVDLEDGSPALDLTPEEQTETCRLAKQHDAQQQQAIGSDQVVTPLVAEFVHFVLRQVRHLPESERADKLRAVADALREESPNMKERVADLLFPQGGAA
ncbi:MAG: hypothetical protein Q8S32_13140 [Burkholderiaceae bacterium]|nr:hypothetical protein [Burkholderiaceae bacterium]